MKRAPLLFLLTIMFLSQPAWASGGAITGDLEDQAGKPAGGMHIILQNGQGATIASTDTDSNGHFAFTNVSPGSYAIVVTQNGTVLDSVAATIMNAETVQKHLLLRSDSNQTMTVVIQKQREQARNDFSPETGTSAYKISDQDIATLPEGTDTSFDKMLEQAPGVAQDSYGQTHVRGEHADLQYRINGILLPEGISGFGQTLDPRMIESMTLLDGTLPAQYGYRTAGIIDIQTKSGLANNGTAELFGGSQGTIEPSLSYGGTIGNAGDYYFTASHLTSDLGIESPTSSPAPVHDHTEQDKQFGYASYSINPLQRVQVIAGNSISYFQIPDNPNQTPQYTLNGVSNFSSSQLNERQFESNQYGTIAWQGGVDGLDVQIAPYVRSSETHYRPDPIGDLVFNGVASDVQYNDLAAGLQNDNSWRVAADHTLRGGFSLQDEQIQTDNMSQVFATVPTLATTPETIVDNSQKNAQLYGVYLQDEWKLTDALTMNYGARFDVMNAYVNESQLSPRLGLVYKLDNATTIHGGYARYFTPPPLELVTPSSVNAFANTTNAPTVTADDPVKAERSNDFDLGAAHQLTKEVRLGVDGYYKQVHDLLDLGQFGQALIYTPFNYEHGRIYGTEFTASYTTQKLKTYGNFAVSRAVGKDIVSSQFNFTDPSELAYIDNHTVHLDHDQTYTASAGASYQVLPKTALNFDAIYGSGLRSGFANTDALPQYVQVNAGITEDLDLLENNKTQLRFTVINLFDTPYELRNGTGIGVGAPQWGPRRGFFLGLAQSF